MAGRLLPADGRLRRRARPRTSCRRPRRWPSARSRSIPDSAEAWATLARDRGAVRARLRARPIASTSARWQLDPRHSRARAQRALWRAVRGAIAEEARWPRSRRAVAGRSANAWVGGMHSYAARDRGTARRVARRGRALVRPRRRLVLRALERDARARVGRPTTTARSTEAPALLAVSGRHPWALGLLAWTYGRAGRAGRGARGLRRVGGALAPRVRVAGWLAVAAGSAGLAEDSIRWAERAVAERDPLVLWARRLPFWDSIRVHPRFREVMRGVFE